MGCDEVYRTWGRLIDETRAWTEVAHAAGFTPFTVFGALTLIERDEDHRRVWEQSRLRHEPDSRL